MARRFLLLNVEKIFGATQLGLLPMLLSVEEEEDTSSALELKNDERIGVADLLILAAAQNLTAVEETGT